MPLERLGSALLVLVCYLGLTKGVAFLLIRYGYRIAYWMARYNKYWWDQFGRADEFPYEVDLDPHKTSGQGSGAFFRFLGWMWAFLTLVSDLEVCRIMSNNLLSGR